MTELAQKICISQQLAAYHYLRHIQEKNLIEGFEIFHPYIDKASSDYFLFILEFDNNGTFAKFPSSLLDKPFARGLGKVQGANALLAHLYLPRTEFRRFVDYLSSLIRARMLKYTYVIQDLGKASRQNYFLRVFRAQEMDIRPRETPQKS